MNARLNSSVSSDSVTHPLGEALPPPGRSLEIVPGVRWVRIGMPFALDHINLWLIRDRLDGPDGPQDGWTVVDTCSWSPEAMAQWEQVFAEELEGLPVLRVIVTHHHPDHVGLADWMCRRWCRPGHETLLWMNPLEHQHAALAIRGHSVFAGDEAARFYAQHGLTDPDALAELRARVDYYPTHVPALPRGFQRLSGGMSLRIGSHEWLCLTGYGHSPEHIALHCPALGLLISGDMVLPKFVAFIGVVDMEPEADPFTQYEQSLEELRQLPADTLVLPSHGTPFFGLHTRIEQMESRHQRRLQEAFEVCQTGPQSAHDVMRQLMKPPRDMDQTLSSMSEALAYLHQLRARGAVRRRLGKDGIWRFEAETGVADAPPALPTH
jgi:glyoxylase-like metal-dependent hydrolase (beta-lactamase superfamily II)